MKNWKDALIYETQSIKEAIKVIDSAGIQLAVVVNAKGKLLGSITDGDIRRGLLEGISLDDFAIKIMNTCPITASPDLSRSELLDKIKAKYIYQIPIVDEKGIILRIETLHELLLRKRKENPIVLMAGGLGTRLRPYTEKVPKPMLEVGERPILETIIRNFISHGFYKFYISVNYKSSVIKNYFGNGEFLNCEIHYLDEKAELGTAGALSLLPSEQNLPLIMMNGDLLTNINFNILLEHHKSEDVMATVCLREFDNQIPYGVVTVKDDCIKTFSEKPTYTYFVNAGIYVFNPEILNFIPHDIRFDINHLFKILLAKNVRMAPFPIREYWLDIGRKNDFHKAKDEFNFVFTRDTSSRPS